MKTPEIQSIAAIIRLLADVFTWQEAQFDGIIQITHIGNTPGCSW